MRISVGLLFAAGLVWVLVWGTDSSPERRTALARGKDGALTGKAADPAPDDPARLLETLCGGTRAERKAAVDRLRGLGKAAVPGLVAILRNGAAVEKLRALRVLEKLATHTAPAVPELLRIVDTNVSGLPRPKLPAAAMEVFEAMGPVARDALPTLIAWLSGNDDHRADTAAWILRDLDKAAAPALPAILEILRSEKLPWGRRLPLTCVIENLGPVAIDAAPIMIARIHEAGVAQAGRRRRGRTDFSPARALGAMGVKAVPLIIAALGDEVEETHFSYQLALRDTGAGAVPALIKALQHDSPLVRENAADVLGDMKFQSDELRRALEEALDDPSLRVRAEAAESLAEQGEAAIPALIKALRSHDWTVRRNAARGLRRHGKKAAKAIPDLIELLGASTFLRLAAADTLGAMGPRAADTAPALVKALARSGRYAQDNIADTLGRIGTAALPAILDALRSRDKRVRAGAARALGRIKKLNDATRDTLANLLTDKDPTVRLRAAIALAPRDIALAALVRGLKHGDKYERVAAAKAIARYKAGGTAALPALFKTSRRLEILRRRSGSHPTPAAVTEAIVAIGRYDVRCSSECSWIRTTPYGATRRRHSPKRDRPHSWP